MRVKIALVVVLISLASAVIAATPTTTTTPPVATAMSADVAALRARIKEYGGKFRDLKATVVVTKSDRRELEKMGDGYAESYQFKKANICYLAPDKLRVNGTLGVMKVEFVTSGNSREVRVPSMHFRKQEDISNQPVKQISQLDVGVLTESIWDHYSVSIVNTETRGSSTVYVLKLQSLTKGGKKGQLLWVDSASLKLLQRDTLRDEGQMNVRAVFLDHKLVEGVWIPVKTEIYNHLKGLAATTETTSISVNTGVDRKEFE